MSDSPKADLWKAVKNPHTRPWLAVAGEVPASLAAHAAWSTSPGAAIGMTVASGALTAATWWAAAGTRQARRLHATASTAAGTGYLTIATFTDPLGGVQLSLLAIGGSVLAASWNVRKAMRVNVDTKTDNGTESESGVLVQAIGKARAALRKPPEVEPNKVTADLALKGGDLTTDELTSKRTQIAGELHVPTNAVRFIPDPDRADHATMVVVPEDQLKKSIPYPGPSAIGGSITDPIPLGLYEDGEPAALWFPADESIGRNATHFLVSGMNGSGKSAGISVAMVEALTRRDVIVWGCDPSKGRQTFGPFLPYLDWVELDVAGGEAMIWSLTQVITARADALGKAGFKNWTPAAHDQLGMPYMIVWLEEAAKLFREGAELEGLVMEARSAGISVIISLQRPSHTTMPTDVREQLGGALCFGVKNADTSAMALPDDVLDAGAAPEAWQNRKPGYAYLVAPGVEDERYVMPLRTYRLDDDEIEAALAIAPRASADPVTAQAAGDAYASRTQHTAQLDDDQRPPEPAAPVSRQQAEEQKQAALEVQIDREISHSLGAEGDDGDDGDEVLVDAEAEIPPTDGVWAFGAAPAQAQAERTTEEAMDALMEMLEEYREAGREQVGPRDFQPFGKGSRIGRSRQWVSAQIVDLADDGIHLEETDQAGVYRLLYPEMATA